MAGTKQPMPVIAGWAHGPDPNAFPDFPSFYRNLPFPLPRFFLDYPRAAAAIPIIYACVTKLAQDCARLPVRFYRGTPEDRTEITRQKGNIVDRWRRPNATQDDYGFAMQYQTSLDINGNAYIFEERFGRTGGAPDELWVMPGHLTQPVVTEHRAPRAYQFLGSLSPILIDAANIIHGKYWNADFVPIGLSPLEASRITYETRYLLSLWLREFFNRGAAMSGVYTTAGAGTASTAKEMKELKKSLMRVHGGWEHSWEPVILEGLDFKQRGLSHKDMEFVESVSLTDSDICRAFGISPVIMGIKEGGGMSDAGAKTDLLLYHENAIMPRIIQRDRLLSEQFCPLYGDGIFAETDTSAVLALQEERLSQMKMVVIAVGRPVLTANEGRDFLGFSPTGRPEDDELFTPQAAPLLNPRPDTGGKNPQLPGSQEVPIEGEGVPAGESEAGTGERARRATGKRTKARRRGVALLELSQRRFRRVMVQIFNRQEKSALAKLEAHWTLSGIDANRINGNGRKGPARRLDVDDLFDDNGAVDLDALQNAFDRLVQERGEQQLAELGVQLEVELNATVASQFVERAAVQVLTETTETTRAKLREALADVVRDGGGFDKAVAAVRDVFDNRRDNAVTIARTETLGAYNFASHSAAEQSGVVQTKAWLTADDELVREAHAEAENEGDIPLDSSWTMDSVDGPVDMDFPGDPDGPPDLVCNCRCTLTFGTDERKVRALRDEYQRTGSRRRSVGPGESIDEWLAECR